MASLQIELVLRLLSNDTQVRSERGFSDRLGIVVVVLLPLHERLHIDRRNDARFVPESAQRTADEMRTEAGFQAYDALRQFLERLNER